MSRIRVLIADDHPVFRYGLRALLLAEVMTMEVVGEATSGEEAVTFAAQSLPDVILMDVNMPGLNGIEATRRILAATPQVGILMLTMFDDDESVFAAMRAGAQGYTNPAIAERLVLSPKTVRNHVSSIFSKLQVAGRAEAIIRARDAGMTRDIP
jgi:DNA-binding NarL/FixJ family response regulator